jgi:hypothetical protein
VTADFELQRNDISFEFRRYLLASFQAYGIKPTSKGNSAQAGLWLPPESEASGHEFNYSRNHFESMLRDPEEVFRFIWENRQALHLYDGAYTRVQSVRPCLRIAEDGFALRETVAEYLQILRLTAKEISGMGIRVEGLPPEPDEILLYGGGVLLFDEYGRLKFHIHNRVNNPVRQEQRLRALVEFGHFNKGASAERRFSHMHRLRALNTHNQRKEGW